MSDRVVLGEGAEGHSDRQAAEDIRRLIADGYIVSEANKAGREAPPATDCDDKPGE